MEPDDAKKRGSRLIGAFIVLLVILFFSITFFISESQAFSPTSLTKILLSSLQIIVFLLFLILALLLGRNLIKLQLERKRKVAGSHFKTKLVFFFTALAFIPTLLLFVFASDLISRNIESWFQTPLDRILADTQSVADGFYRSSEELTYHYAQELSRTIKRQGLVAPESRVALREFVREKLKEYQLDEIGIFLEDEELFTYLNPELPLQDYQDLKKNIVKRAQLGELLRSIEPLGNGEMIRRGVSFALPGVGNVLVATGKFLPQNYAQRIANISAYVDRYGQLKVQRVPVKTFYLMTLIFVTLLIIFAATWIGFQLAKGITVPIEKLAQATREVSRGNLSVRVENTATDELGTLIESFNQMIFDLKEGQAHIAQKTSEIEARKGYIETVLNTIQTGVITLDAGGLITTINPSARDMLALAGAEVVGLGYRAVLADARYDEVVKTIDGGLRNRSRLSDKEIRVSANGQGATVALALSPLRTPDLEFAGLVVVLDDLTQLIKAQRIAAWKEIAQRVAHEIKNPLTPIQLSAERIIKTLQKRDERSADVVQEGARTIIEETRTIKSLVDEFTTFARLPGVRLQPSDLHAVIGQVVGLFEGIFEEVAFETSLAGDVPRPLQIDPEQMKRALINLFDNAIEAMSRKGTLRVATAFDKSDQMVRIEVSDTGPGISSEDLGKLFMPHFSTKKKGSGLGLAIVSQIVSDHNGTVGVENVKPSGARFTIRIPA